MIPCCRCGVEQGDPEQGQVQMEAGVRREHQVLVCPDRFPSHGPNWAGLVSVYAHGSEQFPGS